MNLEDQCMKIERAFDAGLDEGQTPEMWVEVLGNLIAPLYQREETWDRAEEYQARLLKAESSFGLNGVCVAVSAEGQVLDFPDQDYIEPSNEDLNEIRGNVK